MQTEDQEVTVTKKLPAEGSFWEVLRVFTKPWAVVLLSALAGISIQFL